MVAGEELTEDEGQGMDKGGAAARQEWVAAEGAAGQQQEGADAAAAEGQQRVGGGAAAPAAAAEGRSVGPVRRHVVVLSCHGFAPPGEPEMEAAYDKVGGRGRVVPVWCLACKVFNFAAWAAVYNRSPVFLDRLGVATRGIVDMRPWLLRL